MSEEVAVFSAPGGDTGVLCLHGYTGSARSMRPLAEAFAGAGFTVELPLLPGHGTTPTDLDPFRYADWFAAAQGVFNDLVGRCRSVVVAGLSMGGTLSLDLAARHREVAALVLVNPLVDPPAPEAVALLQAALVAGTRAIPSIGSDIAREGQSGAGYDETPIAPLLSLFEATSSLAARLGEVTCPVLLFSSRVDHVVPTSSGDLVATAVAGPVERIFLENSYHVATLDNDQELIERRAVAYVTKVVASR